MNGMVSALRVEGANCAATLYQHEMEGWEATFTTGLYPTKAFTDAGAVIGDMQSMKIFRVPHASVELERMLLSFFSL
jgi:hypothetical protein